MHACLQGFHPGPESNSSYLHCVHDEGKGWVQQAIWGGVAFGMFLVLAIAVWQAIRLCFTPRWMRERDMRKKRKRPLPVSGQVSIVVTDIENYSGEDNGHGWLKHDVSALSPMWKLILIDLPRLCTMLGVDVAMSSALGDTFGQGMG